ncbi:ufm1-specific protease 2 [Microplitis demolitor]|uniref:ufm1-specific protease 2 n=1 Tax=Microplitis demolitor TaxID=69319 RepID=UPI0004400258|nr:ufm1-specific protease 2 [Microplitis demolitor]
MTPKVRISSKVMAKLECLGTATTGRLFGVMCDNYLTVLSFVLNPTKIENSNDEQSEPNSQQQSDQDKQINESNELLKPIDLQLNMPVEIDLCGVLFVDNHEENIPEAFKDIDITDNPLLIKYSRVNGISAYYYVHEQLKSAGKLEFIDEKILLDKFSYIRLKTSVPMITDKHDFTELFQSTRKNIASGNVGFYFPSTKLFLTNNDPEDRDVSVKILSSNQPSVIPTGYTNTIQAEMFMRITKEKISDDNKKNYAPVLQHIKQPFVNYEFNLNIDSLALVGHNLTAPQIYSILVESVCRSLRLIERSIILSSNHTIKIPEMMHFKLPHCDHLISIAYADTSAEKTREYRKKLHEALACDLTRPYFRPGNAVKFLSDYRADQPLLEPHTAIKTSLDNSSLVNGLYGYYHYGQDNFHDSGWGCAYRSLQTIFSWFRFQGYTEQPVPSHRAIQKCLVDIGDKSPNFIGSSQWIGSTEVGFVLETLLDVNSKFLVASSGKDMPDLIDDLRYHFQTQGTPVMIGGGVLAHTILGVSYDENKQLPYWLILDPHYEGKENLSIVLEKGYCGWKGKDFWRKDAFYNMCLPQRPICY